MVFFELPAFAKVRERYLDDDAFQGLQNVLIANPEAGPVIMGTSGLRKVRHGDESGNKGKRGRLRIIYFWKPDDEQIWLFAVYHKNEANDLTSEQRKALKGRLQAQMEAGVLK